ncbi:5204_t:CDS:2 [Gigaspora margarita]|uniref:5204_t:CDS:1 n=1 Tax=Gigaspora margarita TaxID=4874 RepID=A0ABM8W0S8_GIGMA|nr:5204_t:CDS:2 [Gigaspora margarita]
MVNAQARVDQEYPQEIRRRIIILDFSNKNLEGSLILEGFSNLEVLNYNSFHGSLEPLKNLTKLNSITIAGTNIDSGLEYLPVSVNTTGFFDKEWKSFSSLISSCENFGSQKILKRLEEYILLTAVYDFVYHDPQYNEKDVLEAWRIENILEYRQKKKEKLIKDNFISLKSQLMKLKIIFEQQIKPLEFKNLTLQIKAKKAEIINILHSGRGSSAYLHMEIKEMRRKISDNKKLEQHLQEARKITIDSEEVKFFCKEDKNEVCKGAYKDLKRLEKKLNYHIRLEHNLNHYEIALRGFVHGATLAELAKHIAEIQKLTQRLLGRQNQYHIL